MYFLTKTLFFPDPNQADPDGLLAVGGDLSPERLKLAYQSGIFPWFDQDDPILWWSPDPRMVLFPDEVYISKSMRRILDKNVFKITFNKAFRGVITSCREIRKNEQHGTWITDEMIEAYCALNTQGFAKSVEAWQDDMLVGGLYGIDLGHIFCGESMFSKVSNASKATFITLAQHLQKNSYRLLDCQLHNDHLASLGAREIPREEFLTILNSD